MTDSRFRYHYTHSEDMDGFACALQARAAGLAEHLRPIDYRQLEQICPRGPVLVTDLNLGDEHPVWSNPDCLIIDHHRDSPPEGARAKCILDRGGCASMLLLERVLSGDPGRWEALDWAVFARQVDAGDRYLTDDRDHYEASRKWTWLLHQMGWDDLMEWTWGLKQLAPLPVQVDSLVASARQTDQIRGTEAAKALIRRVQVEGREFGLTWLLSGGSSTIGNHLVQEYGLPVGLIIADRTDGVTAQVSLRSANGEARLIAESLGGGGHPDAAGFHGDFDQLIQLWSRGTSI